MKKVGFVTYQNAPNLTVDDALALSHLTEFGFEGIPVVWDAVGIRWHDFDAIIIRSSWDYHFKTQEFNNWLGFVERLNVPIWNPADIIRWNMDKKYLKQLAAQGVKIPQTIWLNKGTSLDLRTILLENELEHAVVKPTISISAAQTWCTSPELGPVHQSRLDALLSTSGALIQRFADQIITKGEWSLLFFGGNYSHAVLKRPKRGDFRVQTQFGGTCSLQMPRQELIEQAEAILHLVDRPLLYARVDGLEIDGEFTLLELELIEPELFLRFHRLAPKRFADAIRAVL